MISCVPINDDKEHEIGVKCWCDPIVQWLDPETGLPWENSNAAPLVIHNAADCRELAEVVSGESLAADKKWELVED